MKSMLIPAARSQPCLEVTKMQSQRKRAIAGGTVVLSALALCTANLAQAEDGSALKTKNVILVHGACQMVRAGPSHSIAGT